MALTADQITAKNFKEFYDRIYPYLGSMPNMVANRFRKGDLYSTDEKIIGQWVDGKPLYQKTVDGGALPNKTTKNVAHNISNLGLTINLLGFAYDNSSQVFCPLVNDGNAAAQIQLGIDSTNIIVYGRGFNFSSFTNSYFTVQYTKTTDSAISIGFDTDYSTTEKIVGTWIDSKPLYQKTFTGTSPSTTGTSISTGLTNVDYCFVKEGVIENSLTYVANVTFVNNDTSGNVNHAVSMLAKKDGSEIYFSYNQKGTLYFASQPYVITLCYTKTTD